MSKNRKVRILFVCTGNICRSPSAEAVFRHAVKQAGLDELVTCDSAGTHDYHIGEPPDARSQKAALRRGYDMRDLRARQVARRDFETFDRILAMDGDNLAMLERICPPEHAHKLGLFCDFHERHAGGEVPDPFYGREQGFDDVLDLIETAAEPLLEHVRARSRG